MLTERERANQIMKEQINNLVKPVTSEGCLLTDNALIAFKMNHYIKRCPQGKNGVAGLKIDISKADKRLE